MGAGSKPQCIQRHFQSRIYVTPIQIIPQWLCSTAPPIQPRTLFSCMHMHVLVRKRAVESAGGTRGAKRASRSRTICWRRLASRDDTERIHDRVDASAELNVLSTNAKTIEIKWLKDRFSFAIGWDDRKLFRTHTSS
jgi:hypothetical protein